MFELRMTELQALGFTPFFFQQLAASDLEGAEVGRVTCERRGEYDVITAQGARRASLSGRLEHALGDDEFPTVGDWVVLELAEPVSRVVQVLERQSVLRRTGVDGSSRAQNLAANVDLCCVVCALSDGDRHARSRALNPRRIERYLTVARQSRIDALVLINKSDLVSREEAEAAAGELMERLPGCRALLVSAQSTDGLAELSAELPAGSSAVLLGSSGVGKSTLVNALIGQALQRTSAERSDDTRGRHTTTERQLLALSNGAFLIDTPGMRELALWADASSEISGSTEIEELSVGCRFRDCKHQGEPGCAVAAAIEAGTLSAERLQHAHKLERELLHQRARVEVRLRVAQQKAYKARTRAARNGAKIKGRA
jgi:ribosome biogenesis GTPase / thiamine phosphate phosphatase